MRYLGLAILTAILLTGCAEKRWSKPDATLEDFNRDSHACVLEARRGDYDLIVVGGHGPRARSVTARDDVTLQILDTVNRPVLVVPEDSG